jgi:DNA mismatch endonuclease (patch repair protein)
MKLSVSKLIAPVPMDRIRSFGNKATELRLLRILRSEKISGWRRHIDLPGRPDFAFPKTRIAVFVDGCFWHGCPLHYRRPHRDEYWQPKLRRNRARDRRVARALRSMGWMVIRFWEHSLTQPKRVARRLQRALAAREKND